MKDKSRSLIMVFLILFIFGIVFFFIYMNREGVNEVEARDSVSAVQKYYTSIEIEEGDTLWSIAGEYMTDEYKNRQEYIKEVQQMNQLTGSLIQSGSSLFIPYYSEAAVPAS